MLVLFYPSFYIESPTIQAIAKEEMMKASAADPRLEWPELGFVELVGVEADVAEPAWEPAWETALEVDEDVVGEPVDLVCSDEVAVAVAVPAEEAELRILGQNSALKTWSSMNILSADSSQERSSTYAHSPRWSIWI